MPYPAFPPSSELRWRRLDGRGHEQARFERLGSGFGLSGVLQIQEEDDLVQLRYSIECDERFCTRLVQVEGEAHGKPFFLGMEADGEGHFGRQGIPLAEFDGIYDIDLGFTPSTNTLPIRRLELRVGEVAAVKTAWLRYPELHLERLEQTYLREGRNLYLFRAIVDGEPFSARLRTDDLGRVVLYEGLWESEPIR